MEDLKMKLDTYRVQLSQIEQAISIGQGDNELLTLQNDMKELISLTEESLLAYEKSKLINLLDQDPEEPNISNTEEENTVDDEMAQFYAELEAGNNEDTPTNLPVETSNSAPPRTAVKSNSHKFSNGSGCILNEEFLDTIENCSDISGKKCQAPISNDWSGTNYHNAMIMSVIENDADNEDEVMVNVVFLNPVTEQMKLCPYLLDGKCRFTTETCKYSHGHPVSLYSLRTFKEPDFSNFTTGCTCIAKQPSGLWGMASVIEILDDHQFSISFLHNKLTCTLGISDILPNLDDDSSSDSDDSDVITLDDGLSFTGARQKIDTSKVGAWEEHTRGIGSKIMKQLGYKPGQGLGKEAQGRVEPVPVEVLPQGKSLDHCMALKERKRAIAEKRAEDRISVKKHHPSTVFQFLNKTLGGGGKKQAATSRLQTLTAQKDSFGIKQNGASTSRKRLGTEMVKNDQLVKNLRARVDKLRGSVARNKEKNPKVAKQLQAKLDEAMAELRTLKSSNKAIEAHQRRTDTHRKMTKF